METVTPARLLRVAHADLRALIDASMTVQRFSLSIFEEAIELIQAHAQWLATLSAEDHYYFLVKNYLYWLSQVPIQDIASLLGIQPQSLSRIRRNILLLS